VTEVWRKSRHELREPYTSSSGTLQGPIERSKHDITFDQAATVFLDALALTVYDEANGRDEERWFTRGFDASDRLVA